MRLLSFAPEISGRLQNVESDVFQAIGRAKLTVDMSSPKHRKPALLGLLLTAALTVTTPPSLWANLAVFSTSDIQRSGNLVPIRKTRVELVNETFTAKLEAETAQVSVDYEFVNTGGADAVTVGFPVDLMPPSGEATTYNLDHWQKDGLQDLRVIDGTTLLPIERTIEETLRREDRPKLAKDVAITRRWSITTIRFKSREKKRVRVRYVVRCIGVDEGFETEIPRKISSRTFLYSFRTASGWGKGRIQKLDISLDTSYLQENPFQVLELEPGLKDKGGGRLHLAFQSAELSRVPDLIVRYDPRPALFQMYAKGRLVNRANWKTGMCGPGKLGSNHLADGNPRTIWTPEFPNRPGNCIAITPTNGSYINAIAVLNGSQVSAADYAKHARIKKLRIESTVRQEEGRPKEEVSEQTLKDQQFDDRVAQFPMAVAQFLDVPSGPIGIIERVKLTILEVYPGENGAPLAISDIYVYGVTPRK
jgi:hypothetical protein